MPQRRGLRRNARTPARAAGRHSSPLAAMRWSPAAAAASATCACAPVVAQRAAAAAPGSCRHEALPRSRQAEILDHPHARLAPAVVARQHLLLRVAVMTVEGARDVVAGTRLEGDAADAGDLGRALEPFEHRGRDAAAPVRRLDREQQQVHFVVAVFHDREAGAIGLADGDDRVGVALAQASQDALAGPAPAQAVLDEIARHLGDAEGVDTGREADRSGRRGAAHRPILRQARPSQKRPARRVLKWQEMQRRRLYARTVIAWSG